MSRILSVNVDVPDSAIVREASEILREGGLVVYPTETLYGIGARADSSDALSRIAAVKRRSDTKPILVIVDDSDAITPLVREITDDARLLMETFWPGPLTLVFPAAAGTLEPLTRGTGTIGIRVPASRFCRDLVAGTGVPVTSTSANRTGEAVAGTAGEIQSVFGDEIDLYIDGGLLADRQPSTVVDVSRGTPVVLREGAISRGTLSTIISTMTS